MALDGRLLLHHASLGALDEPSDEAWVGSAWAVAPSSTDDAEAGAQVFGVAVHARQEGDGEVTVLVLTSASGDTWGLAASLELDEDGAEVLDVLEPSHLLGLVAVAVAPADGAAVTCDCALVSNGQFRLIRSAATPSSELALATAAPGDMQGGTAVVPSGESAVDVSFDAAWSDDEVAVVATPEAPVAAWVSTLTPTGFRLHLSAEVQGDTRVHWVAVHR